MALDPSIILQSRGLQLESPLDRAARVQSLRSGLQQQQLQGLQLQQAQQELQGTQALRSALQANYQPGADGQYSLNESGLVSGLAQAGFGDKALGLQQQLAQQKATAEKAQLDHASAISKLDADQRAKVKEQSDFIASVAPQIQGAQNPEAAYQQALGLAKARGYDISRFPQQYDAGFVSMIHNSALSVKDQLDLGDKQQQRDLTKRGQDITARGQNLTAATTRRGQDLAGGNLGVDPLTGEPVFKQKPLPSEVAGRLALAESYAKQVPDILASIKAGKVGGAGVLLNYGDAGIITQRQESGVDALIRNLTGAGKSESESKAYARRYSFDPTDSDNRKVEKVLQLTRELRATDAELKKQYGQPASSAYDGISDATPITGPAASNGLPPGFSITKVQ